MTKTKDRGERYTQVMLRRTTESGKGRQSVCWIPASMAKAGASIVVKETGVSWTVHEIYATRVFTDADLQRSHRVAERVRKSLPHRYPTRTS